MLLRLGEDDLAGSERNESSRQQGGHSDHVLTEENENNNGDWGFSPYLRRIFTGVHPRADVRRSEDGRPTLTSQVQCRFMVWKIWFASATFALDVEPVRN